jgi:hypothetical protein
MSCCGNGGATNSRKLPVCRLWRPRRPRSARVCHRICGRARWMWRDMNSAKLWALLLAQPFSLFGNGRFWRKAVLGRFTISAKRANRADQPQPEVALHRVILGGFAVDWAERNATARSRSSFYPRSLAPRVFNSLTADQCCHSEKPGQRLFDEPAAFVAPHGTLAGVANIGLGPDGEQAAKRLVDILIAGLRTRT